MPKENDLEVDKTWAIRTADKQECSSPRRGSQPNRASFVRKKVRNNLGIRRAPGSSSCHVSGARPSQKETRPGSKCIVPAASCLRLGPEIPVD